MKSEKRPTATAIIQADNDRVRVTKWEFAPGAETGHHRHEMDYIVVPLVDGVVIVIDAQGTRQAEMKAGISYTRPAGVEHNIVSGNPGHFSFIEIELK